MICLLMNGVVDKMSVYEVNGNTIIFLVQIGLVPKRAPKRVKSTIKLDEWDSISSKWIDSDILVFNTGHWWNRGKLFEIGGYFKVNGKLKLGISIMDAYTTALNTWASWVENMVNTNRTRVFFRTFEGKKAYETPNVSTTI
ncbi:putative PC-Esterase [Helianthus anomalus]